MSSAAFLVVSVSKGVYIRATVGMIFGSSLESIKVKGYKRYEPKKTAYRSKHSQYDAFEVTLKSWLIYIASLL
jgi:hypothetical protein